MLRRIIKIDEEKCNGCGMCASACHEGAIDILGGKARLTREHYCDGLGDCLPACPMGAIAFEEREAPAYDEAAVLRAKRERETPSGCPSSRARLMSCPSAAGDGAPRRSCLSQWPVQIKLLPVRAPFYEDAELLIAADCSAYAYGDFHESFIRGRVCLVGCPKLDAVDYAEKLGEIISGNNIKSVTVTRMEVPCCGGLENAVKRAVKASGKDIELKVVTISTDGRIL